MAVQPLRFSFSSPGDASTSLGLSSTSPYKRKKRSTEVRLTPQQALEYAERIKASKEQPKSFTDHLKSGGVSLGHLVASALEKTQRPMHTITSALEHGGKGSFFRPPGSSTPGGFNWGEALHGAKLGATGREHISGSELLKRKGILVNHDVLRGIAGFTGDVALDPLTYVTGGTAAIAGKTVGGKAGIKATEALAKVEMPAEGASKGVYRKALRAFQGHHDELQRLGKAHPEKFQARSTQSREWMKLLHTGAAGREINPVVAGRVRNTLSQMAHAEARQHTPRGLTIGMFGKATKPLPLRVNHPGALGASRVPVLNKVATSLGEKFRPGYGDPVTHAAGLTRQREQEQFSQRYLDQIQHIFKGHENIATERQVGVLHFFEKKGGVVKKKGKYVLSDNAKEAARKEGYSDAEIAFAEKMHEAGEFLAAHDKTFGLRYQKLGEQGKMYVPHILDRDMEFIRNDMGTDLVSVRGYLKKRNPKHDLSLQDLQKLQAAGHLPKGIEADPFKLLVMRARAAASQHADVNMINALKDVHGVPVKLTDDLAIKAAQQKVEHLAEKIATHAANGPGFKGTFEQEVKRLTGVHKAKLTKQHQATIDKNTALIRKHLDADHSRTTMATVARISNRTAASKALYDKALKDIAKGTDPGLKAVLANVKAARDASLKDLRAVKGEHKKAEQALRKLNKGRKNPAYDKALHSTVAGRATQTHLLKTASGHDIAFPTEIAGAMTKMSKIMGGDEKSIEDFNRGYRQWVSKWKLGVTAVNPGYGIRNTVSDFWNMWLSPTLSIPRIVGAGGKAARLMHDFDEYGKVARAGGKPTQRQIQAVQTMREAYGAGVLSGLFQGDVQLAASFLKSGKGVRALAADKRLLKAYTKFATDINRNRENWGRLTHYIARREQGMGVADAAFQVKKAHFDYEDLTPFEQRHMKQIAPFYTWTRKNLPYQIESLIMRPGKMAAFPKLGENMSDSLGEEGPVPGYFEGSMNLPLGAGRYVNPMIGITDLMKLQNPVGGAASMVNPVIKTPAELILNKSAFTGAPIKDPSGHPRVGIRDGLVAGLLGSIPGNPLNVGDTSRGGVTGAGMDPRAAYLAGQLPFVNALINKGSKVKTRNEIPYVGALGYGLGVNVKTVNPEEQELINELNFQDKWKGILKGYRDEGKVPPAKKRKKSANQRMLERALQGGG